MLRTGPCENIALQNHVLEFSRAHRIEIGSGKNFFGVLQPDLPSNGGRGHGVVAGDHLDANPRLMTLLHCRDGFFSRRIDHPDHSDESQAAFEVPVLQYGVS